MNKHRFLQIVVIVLLMAVTVTGMTVRSASADETGDPFKASISGTVAITGQQTFKLDGDGQASHLGNLQVYQASGTFTGPNTDVLIETLTAANGDTLTIRCEQVLEEIGQGVFRGTDTWTIIGGTGRFSGATGSGSGETTADLNTYTFTKELDGTINVPDDEQE